MFFVAGFAAGLLTDALRPKESPFIGIDLINRSSQDIESIHIRNENRVELVENIPANQSKRAKFYCPGESSYSLVVVFKDGTRLSGGGGYIEPDDGLSATISDKSIESHDELPNISGGLWRR